MEILGRIEKIIKKFSERNVWIAIAESCTGGYISHMITNISGASNVFERGVICYGNQAKIDLLSVDPQDIEIHGAVSEQVAEQMARNVRTISKTCEIGIGTTGIAGPTGGAPEKPVGLVFVGFSTKKETFVKKYIFNTDRLTFKQKVLEAVVKLLENYDIGKI